MSGEKKPTHPLKNCGDDPVSSIVAKCPKISGADDKEQKMIKDSHQKALKILDKVINHCLENAKSKPNSLVSEYFGIKGTDDEDIKKIEQLIQNYKKIQTGMDDVSYKVEHKDIKSGEPYTVAYVYTLPLIHGIGNVHVLFPAFKKETEDARAGTLIHELSHYVLGTEDHAYDWQPEWQILTQEQQMDNADSYGEFATACFQSTINSN